MCKRAIVTGGTSFIGRAVINELVSVGYDVVAIIRPESNNKNLFNGMNHIQTVCDSIDCISRENKKIGNGDVFIHLAWCGADKHDRNNSAIQECNMEMSRASMQIAVVNHCKRYVFVGSQAEYGRMTVITDETTDCKPMTAYGKAKFDISKELSVSANMNSIEFVHARVFSVYGPGDHSTSFLSQLIEQLSEGKTIVCHNGDAQWNYLYISDAAHALCLLADSELQNEIYNIAGTDTRQLKKFTDQVRSIIGKGKVIYSGETNCFSLIPDIHRLQTDTGFEPMISFESGIKSMLR